MPWLLSETDYRALQRHLLGTTKDRMLREIAEMIVALTADNPLILVLEDLHWSDSAILDLLAVLARRRESARLLILGTYRPMGMLRHGHPLPAMVRELQIHGHCVELSLSPLSEAAIQEYLTLQFPEQNLSTSFIQWLHRRTEGNPLFLGATVNHLVAHGWLPTGKGRGDRPEGDEILAREVPETLRQMIDLQFNQLSPEEQEILTVGSIVGTEFTAALVVAGIKDDLLPVEEWCEGMVRRGQFLRTGGVTEWPDGTVTARYNFLHVLYPQVISKRISLAQRQRLHQWIGLRLEEGYGERVGEIAAELALHFEQGRDYRRAVSYHQQVAEQALRRHAYQEAITHLTRGLELVLTLPDPTERIQRSCIYALSLGQRSLRRKGRLLWKYERITCGHVYCATNSVTLSPYSPRCYRDWGRFISYGVSSRRSKSSPHSVFVSLSVCMILHPW
jgi:predicted ATPase